MISSLSQFWASSRNVPVLGLRFWGCGSGVAVLGLRFRGCGSGVVPNYAARWRAMNSSAARSRNPDRDSPSKAFSTGKVFLSPDVIKEIDVTIRRLSPKLGEEKTEFLIKLWRRLASLCTVLEPVGKSRICRDPKDGAYLHLCIAAEAKFLITGDKDLLAVEPGRVAALPDRLRIVTPRRFLEIDVPRKTPEPGRS